MKFLFLGIVAKGGLSRLDRADGAEHVGENLTAVFQHRAVFRLEWHIVALVGKENQVVVLCGERAGDRLIKCFKRLFVVQAGVPQRHEKPVLVGVYHLTCLEAQVDEVFLLRAGQDAAENGKIAFLVLLAHEGDRLAEGG